MENGELWETHIWGADITLSMGIPLGELFKVYFQEVIHGKRLLI